jgi:TetR/AcrR family transcriptional repressor of nem operon
MTQAIRYRIDYLMADADGGTLQAKRRAAITAWTSMVGAMVLARIVDDETLSKEILSEARTALPLR